MVELLDRSPLAGEGELSDLTMSGEGVTVSALPRQGLILLRGPESDSFIDSVRKGAEVALSLQPNTSVEAGDVTGMWTRPGGWMIRCPHDKVQTVQARLDAALKDIHHLALDVSHQYVTYSLAGPGVHRLLAKDCALALGQIDQNTGWCARTLLGDIPVFLFSMLSNGKDGELSYGMIVDQSLARFAWWRLGNMFV